MDVELGPGTGAKRAAHLLEIGGARQRREDREAGLKEAMALDERPEPLEVRFGPRRVDDEIAGHPVTVVPRDLDAADALLDRRILLQAVEPLVGGRLETEEDVEVL